MENHSATTKQTEVYHRFSKNWDDSDIIFYVEGSEFHCHYSILKHNSPVFSVMFTSNFKEGKDKRAELPGKETDAFLAFMNLVYPMSERFELSKGKIHTRNSYTLPYLISVHVGISVHPGICYQN